MSLTSVRYTQSRKDTAGAVFLRCTVFTSHTLIRQKGVRTSFCVACGVARAHMQYLQQQMPHPALLRRVWHEDSGLQTSGAAQSVGFVGCFPWQIDVSTAEVTVGSGLAINRPAQLQVADNRTWAQVEVF